MFKLTKDINIATRVFGGIIYSYGNSNSAPYVDQFYVAAPIVYVPSPCVLSVLAHIARLTRSTRTWTKQAM